MGQQPVVEEKSPGLINNLEEQLLDTILGYNNKNGLDLKQYRNQVFVSKLWRHLAILSIKILDLAALKENSSHRKCTLLAHIFADYDIHRFPNLKTLKVSFVGVEALEFYDKLISTEKRDFSEEQRFFSANKKLDRIDKNQINNWESMKKRRDDGRNLKILRSIPDMCSIAWNTYRYSNTTDIPFWKRVEKKEEIYNDLSKRFITSLADLRQLEHLTIITSFNLDLSFIAWLPKLKYFHASTTDTFLSKGGQIFIEPLNQLYQPHNIETLRIGSSEPFSSFQNWNIKFPCLTKLSISTGVSYDNNFGLNDFSDRMTSLIENLPQLTNLKLGGISSGRPFQNLYKLTNLTKLNLSLYFTQNNDLIDIAQVFSLRELVVLDVGQCKEKSFRATNGIYQLFDEEAIRLFELTRADVFTIFRYEKIPEFWEEMKITPI